MDFKDHYQISGVDDKADFKTTKAAYRQITGKNHLDVSIDDDNENVFKATPLKIIISAQDQDGESIRDKGQGIPAWTGDQVFDVYLKIKYLTHKNFTVSALDWNGLALAIGCFDEMALFGVENKTMKNKLQRFLIVK